MNETESKIISIVKQECSCQAGEILVRLNTLQKPVTRTALHWYLNKLTRENRLARVARGIYSISQKKPFLPGISPRMRKISDMLKAELPFSDFCLYEGSELQAYQHNIAPNGILYVETQRDSCESAFNILKREGISAFIRPTEDTIYHYADLSEDFVFIKNLTSESPVQTIDGIIVPKLEKILVDIRIDKDFYYLHGTEAFYFLRNAVEQNSVNRSTLLRYARRRNIEAQVKKDLEELRL